MDPVAAARRGRCVPPHITGRVWTVGMGRPSLPIGTAGKVWTDQTPTGWYVRAKYRDYDGQIRPVQRQGRTKAEAERRPAEAIRDPPPTTRAPAQVWVPVVQRCGRSPRSQTS